MATTCLLDSSVIIDAINDRRGYARFLEELISKGILLACCSINITEVYMGMRPHETQKTEDLLDSLEYYPVTRDIAKHAGDLYRKWRQKGLTLSLPDLTIATVALHNGLLLATANTKDFPMPELRLQPLP